MYNQLLYKEDIKQLIAGDETVFRLVYGFYSSKIYKLAYRFLKDQELSEEIVQETFITFWLNRDKLDPDVDLWPYLYVITKRLSINSLKQIYKSTDNLKLLIQRTILEHNPTEEHMAAEDLKIFTQKIIDQLPRQQQLVFKLSRNEGLSYKEIADKLQISQHTVRNHMIQALKTLKTHLKSADLIFFLAIIIHH
ncbi:RNA polymerase sigma-70 factor (ECF subfamily) [Mucilaginibacter lappiensis]|uniref:RNA polymerase sigma-70 factor (ECF subfamily) n=1 Tax=Mucilaginibacter lappiensis TaxID=354630 RepID=A0ABR6PCR5_9SPHI|nr:RNA polymerase sigma-70 factor [Mucilaginibacter lappiensis]MBB6107546.1 RNA polymerase sigma-70 factor (ECF subfamily) [Mucilaginibacter lappiensis]